MDSSVGSVDGGRLRCQKDIVERKAASSWVGTDGRAVKSATILSFDDVGAYNSISRRAMFRGLMDMVDGEKWAFREALLGQPLNVHLGR